MPSVTVGDTDIVYYQSGEGPDIVWIAGGGDNGSPWRKWNTPAFDDAFRSTSFANRGVGETVCRAPEPWTIADLAADAAGLIEAVCNPPVAVVGLSMGALTVLQLALDRPDLMTVGVAMGCAASGSEGWLGYYMQAEVDYRRAGGRLSGRMSTLHYASMLYPAQVLGDPAMFPIIEEMLGGEFEEDNEDSLIGQWQACIDFDVDRPAAGVHGAAAHLRLRAGRPGAAAVRPQGRRDHAHGHVARVRRHGPLLDLRPPPRDAQPRDPQDRRGRLMPTVT